MTQESAKIEITAAIVELKQMTWGDVVKHYWPDISEDEVDRILWEETCYPFDTKLSLKQIYNKYQSSGSIATK